MKGRPPRPALFVRGRFGLDEFLLMTAGFGARLKSLPFGQAGWQSDSPLGNHRGATFLLPNQWDGSPEPTVLAGPPFLPGGRNGFHESAR